MIMESVIVIHWSTTDHQEDCNSTKFKVLTVMMMMMMMTIMIQAF